MSTNLLENIERSNTPASDDQAGTRFQFDASRYRSVLLGLCGVAILVAVWFAIWALKIWPELIIPAPGSVWQRFIEGITTHDNQTGLMGYYLWDHLWASLWRVLRGLFFAIIVGSILGVLLGTVRIFRELSEPLVNFLRALPPLGYFSILIIWFGIEEASKVWLLYLAALAPIALSVASGIESIPPGRIQAARALGANRWQMIRYVQFPSALPQFFTGTRLAAGFAWTTIVAAETVNGVPGIGGLAWSTKKFNQTDVAILCVILIGITAILLDLLIRQIEKKTTPWAGRA